METFSSIIEGLCTFFLALLPQEHCTHCHKVISGKSHEWTIDGVKQKLCDDCNEVTEQKQRDETLKRMTH